MLGPWQPTKGARQRTAWVLVDKDWKESVVDVKQIGDKMLALKLIITRETINVISAYVPQVGSEEFLQ